MGVGKGERAVGGQGGVGGEEKGRGIKDVFPLRPSKDSMLGELEPVALVEGGHPRIAEPQRGGRGKGSDILVVALIPQSK